MVTVLIYIPQTNLETIFITISMIINCGIFGYAINYCNNLYIFF